MAQISDGNETSGAQKAKADKLKVIASKVTAKAKPERYYITVYKNGKMYLPYIPAESKSAMEEKKQRQIDKFPNDSITFSKIKAL